MGIFEIMIVIIVGVISVLPFWKIFSKAGFPGPLSLLMLVPLVNIAMIFFLAFAEWPALKQAQKSGGQ